MVKRMQLKLVLIFVIFIGFAFAYTPAPWDLETAYKNSENIFIAEVIESEASLEIETDRVGKTGESGKVVRVVWTDARRFKLKVLEVFKGEQPDVFNVYNGGGAKLKEETGDSEAASSTLYYNDGSFNIPRPMLKKGEQYIFYMNLGDASKMAEIGWRSAHNVRYSREDLAILRILSRENSEWSMTDAGKAYRDAVKKRTAELQKIDEALESEYLAILNTTPDLSERKQKLHAHLKKLGYESLWHESKELHRTHSYPPETKKEWVWYNASQEIAKIDMILAVRKQHEQPDEVVAEK